jgi:preprotein translocase subunit SecE
MSTVEWIIVGVVAVAALVLWLVDQVPAQQVSFGWSGSYH